MNLVPLNFPTLKQEAAEIDWSSASFCWKKAFVSAGLSALAYEEITDAEYQSPGRARILPSDQFQTRISDWESNGIRKTLKDLHPQFWSASEPVIREHVVAFVTNLQNITYITFRGTTKCFDDILADVSCGKVDVSIDEETSASFHKGFYNALEECYEEVVRLLSFMPATSPICITGHSLGGAMAAIMYCRMTISRKFPQSKLSCYAFGTPRFLGAESALDLLPPYHIFNELDWIPTWPMASFGYIDFANEYCIDRTPRLLAVGEIGRARLGAAVPKDFLKIILGSDHRVNAYLERTYLLRGSDA